MNIENLKKVSLGKAEDLKAEMALLEKTNPPKAAKVSLELIGEMKKIFPNDPMFESYYDLMEDGIKTNNFPRMREVAKSLNVYIMAEVNLNPKLSFLRRLDISRRMAVALARVLYDNRR